MAGLSCHHCHKDTGLEAGSPVFRTTDCPYCSSDLRCCVMCKFYEPNSYNECRETQADRVAEKKKANFCGFFEFGNKNNHQEQLQNQVSAADALFKK